MDCNDFCEPRNERFIGKRCLIYKYSLSLIFSFMDNVFLRKEEWLVPLADYSEETHWCAKEKKDEII